MLRHYISKLIGYRYMYRVELSYIRKNSNQTTFSITMTACLTTPNYFNNFRDIKKGLAKDLINMMPKQLLCNGNIRIEPIMYMGYIKKV